jgi:hypothetical protein
MLGQHLQTLGEHGGAEQALRCHLNIVLRTYGAEHPAAALAYHALSELQRQRGDLAGATTVCLCDGQEALWQACAGAVADPERVEVLDLLHVTPRLWQAARLLYGDQGPEVVPFVRQRLTQVLQGKVGAVIRALRRLAAIQGLRGAKRRALHRICGYLRRNRERMRYDEYLRAGYPIASGVIEGACRHLVKDRLERAGMHWTPQGAQAMLDLRSMWIAGQWETFQEYRIERDRERRYPHRDLVAGEAFFALAT